MVETVETAVLVATAVVWAVDLAALVKAAAFWAATEVAAAAMAEGCTAAAERARAQEPRVAVAVAKRVAAVAVVAATAVDRTVVVKVVAPVATVVTLVVVASVVAALAHDHSCSCLLDIECIEPHSSEWHGSRAGTAPFRDRRRQSRWGTSGSRALAGCTQRRGRTSILACRAIVLPRSAPLRCRRWSRGNPGNTCMQAAQSNPESSPRGRATEQSSQLHIRVRAGNRSSCPQTCRAWQH